MNFLSLVPIDQIESMVTSALLQAITSSDKTPKMDTTPYQMYMLSQQQGTCRPQVGINPMPQMPKLPTIQNNFRI